MTKATSRQGRTNKYGKVYNANHNFKKETRDQESHIDHDRTQTNLYHRYGIDQGWNKESFDAKEFELKRYQELYGNGQEAKNERYMKQGHKERCKTIEQVYTSPRTCPQESIWQVGNIKNEMDPTERTKILVASASAVINSLKKEHGENFIPLDLALHRDEGLVNGKYIGLDHIHFRCTFAVKDKDGNLVPNQNEALKQMGYELPDPNKPSGKFNNLSMSFSADVRERFYRELEARGIELDREVKNPSQKHKERLEYVIEQQNKTIADQNSLIDTLKGEIGVLRAEKDKAKEKHLEVIKEVEIAENEAERQGIKAMKNAEVAETFSKSKIKANKSQDSFTMNRGYYQEATSQVQTARRILESDVFTQKEKEEYKRATEEAHRSKSKYDELAENLEQEIERRAEEKASLRETIDHNRAERLERELNTTRNKFNRVCEGIKLFLGDQIERFERFIGMEIVEREHTQSIDRGRSR